VENGRTPQNGFAKLIQNYVWTCNECQQFGRDKGYLPKIQDVSGAVKVGAVKVPDVKEAGDFVYEHINLQIWSLEVHFVCFILVVRPLPPRGMWTTEDKRNRPPPLRASHNKINAPPPSSAVRKFRGMGLYKSTQSEHGFEKYKRSPYYPQFEVHGLSILTDPGGTAKMPFENADQAAPETLKK
jgi:hypothetical protein